MNNIIEYKATKYGYRCRLYNENNSNLEPPIIHNNKKSDKWYLIRCPICYENNREVFLPDCGHTILCMKCVKIMSKT